MLVKLVKYDLLFGLKRYGVLFLLLCGTWISGLVISLINNSYLNSAFLFINIIISVLFVGAYIINSLQLFYNALSGDESYLNYTIPVNTVSLVLSKLLAIWFWGAAMVGTLILTWVSFYHTLLAKMGIEFQIKSEILDPVINMGIAQFIMLSCLLAFSISIFNTPRLKVTNSGMAVVAIVSYVLTQAVGVIQVGLMALWQYIADPEVLKACFNDSFTPAQEMIFIDTMQNVMIVSSLLLIPLFFWLTVRTVAKRRSV